MSDWPEPPAKEKVLNHDFTDLLRDGLRKLEEQNNPGTTTEPSPAAQRIREHRTAAQKEREAKRLKGLKAREEIVSLFKTVIENFEKDWHVQGSLGLGGDDFVTLTCTRHYPLSDFIDEFGKPVMYEIAKKVSELGDADV